MISKIEENESWGWFIDIESNVKKDFVKKEFIKKDFVKKDFEKKEYSYLSKSNRIIMLYNLVGIGFIIYIFYSIL
jgi:hypothetical protein